MKKLLLLLSILLVSHQPLLAQPLSYENPPLNIEEEDGSPSTFPYKLKFLNGSVIDNGDETSSVNYATTDFPVGTLYATDVGDSTIGGSLAVGKITPEEGFMVDINGSLLVSNGIEATGSIIATGSILTGIGVDTPKVFNSGGSLSLQPDAQGNINCFANTDVADGDDGKILSVNRRAAEGDTYLHLFVNDDQWAHMSSNWDMSIYSNAANGVIELGAVSTNIVRLIGDNYNSIGEPSGTENMHLRHYGYITADAAQRYVDWQLDDTDDWFHLTRSDVNILGFKVEMPMTVGDDLTANAITGTSFTIGANTLDGTEWANLDGQNQSVKTTSSPTFTTLNLTADTNQIVFDSDAGVTTTLRDTAATSSKTISLPNYTGTLYITGGTDVSVADGGTGRSSHTAYALIAGGTTTTGAQQSIANSATAGTILRSSGTSVLPAWSTATYPATTTDNQLLYSSSANTIGGSANLTFDETTFTTLAISCTTIDTGQGANELYDMNQDVQTTDSPTFANVNIPTNGKLYLEGAGSDTYITFDGTSILFYVNNVKVGEMK